jgi:hypothetical protein
VTTIDVRDGATLMSRPAVVEVAKDTHDTEWLHCWIEALERRQEEVARGT